MKNPNLQYPGDLGCSYSFCPNRREARLKRGTMMPLGEMQSFAAGMAVHKACMQRILKGGGVLDDVAEGPYTAEVAEEEAQ